ncbi:Bcr/CflA family efflux MFS transporter [Candidatus Gromoviella agglomerans]|uniref:Bcr/CflA family efflux MFS transporter n=1 Tax=Candidatus Gromoviella agglomerans TaxID=2806609 RepID=UPI001E3AF31F|nr:Bcr/CflA family efflux MFS transporter [Candidatus Gromoviella agglomerans]UFX98425.1 Putative multidrug efflux MFS transporter [Candidatus Gromoviella agglomerans]
MSSAIIRASVLFISALPQISETVYTPILPALCKKFGISEENSEYTISIYLLAFSFGVLVWGKMSDSFGRKACVIWGLLCFILGCLGCVFSQNATQFMCCRAIQGVGASIGSVLGQVIIRDMFSGKELVKVYAWNGSYTGLLVMIASIFGLWLGYNFKLVGVFAYLAFVALLMEIFIRKNMPETHLDNNRNHVKIMRVFKIMIVDKKVIGFCLLVAGCNGIRFSYLAEAPFCMIETLRIEERFYYSTFTLIVLGSFFGGIFTKQIADKVSRKFIIWIGLILILFSALFSLSSTLFINKIPNDAMAMCLIISQSVLSFGHSMVSHTSLSSALINYTWCTGTASSIFGFCYYIIISFLTLCMGFIHNGSLYIMPLYFVFIAICMIVSYELLIHKENCD